MRKVLASVGIGNASVNTVLPSETVRPGESVEAEVRTEGGDADQEVRRIELAVKTRYRTGEGHKRGTVGRMHLTDGFTASAGESRVETATLEIPWDTPVTVDGIEVWVETELDVTGVDPEDRDHLEIRPTPRFQAVLDAMEGLGFSVHGSKCLMDPHGRFGGGVVQEFELRPGGGPFDGALDEVELVPRETAGKLTLFVEVDRRGGLLGETTGTDESHASLTVTSDDVGAIREELRRTIERYA
jgi:sporulation-control protein